MRRRYEVSDCETGVCIVKCLQIWLRGRFEGDAQGDFCVVDRRGKQLIRKHLRTCLGLNGVQGWHVFESDGTTAPVKVFGLFGRGAQFRYLHKDQLYEFSFGSKFKPPQFGWKVVCLREQ
jgi:hypothetical protein